MKRRKFLSFSILTFLPSTLLINCKRNKKIVAAKELNSLQNTLIDYYNDGGWEEIIPLEILSLIDKNCTYAADSVIGCRKKFEQSLRIMPKYLARKECLEKIKLRPLRVKKRKTEVLDDVGWILCELRAHSQKRKYGILTQIFKRNGTDWKIVHHHFSSKKASSRENCNKHI